MTIGKANLIRPADDQELIKRLRAKKQKGNRFDSLEYEAADRIEELAKERDDYAHKLMEANNTYTEMHVEIERLSAKLAKAVAMFKAIEMWDAARGYPMPYRVRDPMRAVLAELEGK
ncbi:hypothetical protein UFOVP233_86 [uncultured Caudovirales phage]|uniref:Uncharacterized protein n=1 Tax=uncultured Caudovirales phage TaxID=2100421 RepID=A0A6J7WUF7_9CAUD|nr:hypothetical protein UFOVP233_86 [uncultured Caudovirales phage]